MQQTSRTYLVELDDDGEAALAFPPPQAAALTSEIAVEPRDSQTVSNLARRDSAKQSVKLRTCRSTARPALQPAWVTRGYPSGQGQRRGGSCGLAQHERPQRMGVALPASIASRRSRLSGSELNNAVVYGLLSLVAPEKPVRSPLVLSTWVQLSARRSGRTPEAPRRGTACTLTCSCGSKTSISSIVP
jgi:hypothetical protein